MSCFLPLVFSSPERRPVNVTPALGSVPWVHQQYFSKRPKFYTLSAEALRVQNICKTRIRLGSCLPFVLLLQSPAPHIHPPKCYPHCSHDRQPMGDARVLPPRWYLPLIGLRPVAPLLPFVSMVRSGAWGGEGMFPIPCDETVIWCRIISTFKHGETLFYVADCEQSTETHPSSVQTQAVAPLKSVSTSHVENCRSIQPTRHLGT